MRFNVAPLLANQGAASVPTPPPSGRTGALSAQLPFCGRSYSAKAGEELKLTAKKRVVYSELVKLFSTASLLPGGTTGRRNTQKQVEYHYFSDKGGSLQDL